MSGISASPKSTWQNLSLQTLEYMKEGQDGQLSKMPIKRGLEIRKYMDMQ